MRKREQISRTVMLITGGWEHRRREDNSDAVPDIWCHRSKSSLGWGEQRRLVLDCSRLERRRINIFDMLETIAKLHVFYSWPGDTRAARDRDLGDNRGASIAGVTLQCIDARGSHVSRGGVLSYWGEVLDSGFQAGEISCLSAGRGLRKIVAAKSLSVIVLVNQHEYKP